MSDGPGPGGSIRANELEEALGLPVVAISAAKNEGIEELVEHAIHVARYQEKPARQDFCDKDDYGGAVHRCLHAIMHMIEDHARRADLPVRFAASRLIDGDTAVENALELDENEKEMVEHIILQMESERGLDRNAAMAEMRFSFIQKLCEKTVIKPHESKESRRSRHIDRILTGKWTALPIFLAVISLVIWLSIDVLGAPLQDLLEEGIQWLAGKTDAGMTRWGVAPAVRSLVVDGIFGGVGTVVSFVPIIIILFFFLSMLEDSGYMARVAFVSDKLLRTLGLTGRSIVPLLIGFGCSVPAVMATRTLPSAHDRRLTVLLTPFMSCSAKIPIYAFFTAAFFPGHGGIVLVILYLSAILVGILVSLLSKKIHPDREPAPFVMELPNYRMPGFKNVTHLLWDKTKDFLQRAFTVIAGRSGRLAHRHRAGHRIPGQGKRGFHHAGARRDAGSDDPDGCLYAGLLPPLHALRSGYCRRKAGARRKTGGLDGHFPMSHSLAGSRAGLPDRRNDRRIKTFFSHESSDPHRPCACRRPPDPCALA